MLEDQSIFAYRLKEHRHDGLWVIGFPCLHLAVHQMLRLVAETKSLKRNGGEYIQAVLPIACNFGNLMVWFRLNLTY